MANQMNSFELPPSRCNNVIAGISAVVGVIGGFYVLTQGFHTIYSKIVDKKNQKSIKQDEEEQQFCNVCCTEIQSEDTKSYVKCCTCNKNVCRDIKCADWLPKSGEWECQLCHSSKESMAQTSSWVAEQMSFNQQKYVYPMRARSEIYIPITDCTESSMQFESVSQIGANSHTITAEQKVKIREYVEELVASMLGGSLDKISVMQLSKSENYLQLFEKYHSILSNVLKTVENSLCLKVLNGDLPGVISDHNNQRLSPSHNNNHNDFSEISQVRLRQLIETILAETLRTPIISSGAVSEIALDTHSNAETIPYSNGDVKMHSRRHRTEHYFEPKAYQDLLATAVLNKIVDKQGNSRLFSESSPDLSAHNIDENFNIEENSISSCSSVEPRSECSYTDNEQILNNNKIDNSQQHKNLDNSLGRESALSDYVANHTVPLPDFSAPPTESEEDDFVSVTSSKIGDGTWEDNWLFKKKRSSLSNSTSTNGCGMLVPAPTEDIRAQIGDKTADEISDLSEFGSDTDDSSLDLLRTKPVNNRLLNKHVIGGENTKMALDELIECASIVSGTLIEETQPAYNETKNEQITQILSTKTETFNEHVNTVASTKGEKVNLTNKVEYEPLRNSTAETQKPISDQLSSDSNCTDESAPTYVDTLLANPEVHEKLNTLTSRRVTKTNNITNTNLTNGVLLNSTQHNKCTTVNIDQRNDDGPNIKIGDSEDDGVFLIKNFVPGSIAEREYKKWNNAVDMPNNPYAPEALKRRISGSQERFLDLPNISPSSEQCPIELLKSEKVDSDGGEDYKRYCRDYYVNNITKNSSVTNMKCASPTSSNEGHNDEDIVINEPTKVTDSQTHVTAQVRPETGIYQAVPAQAVVEDHASIETFSTPSMQSLNTITSSDDSDTVRVYDFNKQETTKIRQENKVKTGEDAIATASIEPVTDASTGGPTAKKPRPTELAIEANIENANAAANLETPSSPSTPVVTPARGSTPTAFKFLQPKRKLIDPSQVLSFDEDMPEEPLEKPEEKAVIEEDVARALPSVKALARAFILASNKNTKTDKRWPMPKTTKNTLSPIPVNKLETSPSVAEIAEDATISSDLSSLETDPPTSKEVEEAIETVAEAVILNEQAKENESPVLVKDPTSGKSNAARKFRSGFLRSNIAFFENLKFK